MLLVVPLPVSRGFDPGTPEQNQVTQAPVFLLLIHVHLTMELLIRRFRALTITHRDADVDFIIQSPTS